MIGSSSKSFVEEKRKHFLVVASQVQRFGAFILFVHESYICQIGTVCSGKTRKIELYNVLYLTYCHRNH